VSLTGMSLSQLNNWLINSRRRMLKRLLSTLEGDHANFNSRSTRGSARVNSRYRNMWKNEEVAKQVNSENAFRDQSEKGNDKARVSIINRKMSQTSDDWSQRWNGQKRHLQNSCKSWSHWSDQINQAKRGGVGMDCIMHGSLLNTSCWIQVASCSNLTVELFFKLMALYTFLLTWLSSSTAASLTWFETLLNNYELEYLHLIPPRPVSRLILQFCWWSTLLS